MNPGCDKAGNLKNRKNVAIVFGVVLRDLRKERLISQEKLAFECELDRTFISLLETGQRMPSLETMLAISHGLQIPLAQLAELIERKINTEPNA